jgi:hypothetical protein
MTKKWALPTRSASRATTTLGWCSWAAGLEHLPHAALAEPFEDDVLPQDEVVAAAEEDLVDLVGGEPAALQQFAGQGARLGEARLELARDLVELRRGQQRQLAERLDEAGDGVDEHGRGPHARRFVPARPQVFRL